ncbi:MAG: peptidylprolyl isomerase [Lachnospiraceae bacterium]|nr:peptidylprolyl isomerase [Lachnospiraceae bacterium]
MKSIGKTVLLILITALAMLTAFGCGNSAASDSSASDKEESQTTEETATETADSSEGTDQGDYLSGLWTVKINVKDYGTIVCELDADTAPITVTNFVNLADSGYYNGLTFHRIISGFMIQGGSPNGDGIGGSGTNIKGEFSENGVENNISHVRGTISMARSTDYDSGSAQFFIVHEDSTFLDGSYAAFGHVTEGMDIVDKICSDTPVVDSNGTVEAENQPVIESVTVVR